MLGFWQFTTNILISSAWPRVIRLIDRQTSTNGNDDVHKKTTDEISCFEIKKEVWLVWYCYLQFIIFYIFLLSIKLEELTNFFLTISNCII